jgi:hypothetical protein
VEGISPKRNFNGAETGLEHGARAWVFIPMTSSPLGVAISRRFIREHPDSVRRYGRSPLKAVHRIYTDKETSLKVLTKYFGGKIERDILEKSWELLIDGHLLPKLRRLELHRGTRPKRPCRQPL